MSKKIFNDPVRVQIRMERTTKKVVEKIPGGMIQYINKAVGEKLERDGIIKKQS